MSQGLSIYCIRPITGRSFQEVFAYYDRIVPALRAMGYRVWSPMTGKDHLRTATGPAPSTGYRHAVSTDRAITERDHWMVEMADVAFANLLGADSVSIGSVSELAVAHHCRCHTITVMEDGNPHEHGFILGESHVVFPTQEEALDYLAALNGGRHERGK
jgi:hypothetical protein